MRKEDTVKLISAEGFEFVIHKEAAMVSQTIRNMLTSPGGFAETEHGEVTFPEISTTILEKICQYFYWSLQYASNGRRQTFLFHILRMPLSIWSREANTTIAILLTMEKETEFPIEPETDTGADDGC
ncbi:elongin-C [Populus alba x Populus x berolinensis]|uniref:Elongin-C n=1 Tax=Populus alba x Populus x berolinensis TaxID=444605 RepID=A0AAD6MFJ6_9ROSI|nr:elongin-C [Populus alba x Populus x berolinensis]